jgi:ubiquitin C-terminal hydrolase
VTFIEEYKQMKRSEGSEGICISIFSVKNLIITYLFITEFGEAFSPEYVYDALRGLKRFDSMKGRQEDAEEFLGFLLGGLHEEFLSGK